MNLPFRKPVPADPVTIPRKHVEAMIAELDGIKLDIGDAIAYLADGRTAKAKDKLLALLARFGQ